MNWKLTFREMVVPKWMTSMKNSTVQGCRNVDRENRSGIDQGSTETLQHCIAPGLIYK